ncbi:MAG TPA: hypothetical protein VGZ02_09640 [Candidatus Baltobacteraceae bacterium]|jgi:hypothetical protein|nr:hypothetical protein [Candidatus Baltobacteraceae bacterium]
MYTTTVSYATLVRILGVPGTTAMDADATSHEWNCGCMAYRAVEDQCVVRWCDDHRRDSTDDGA